mgnify:CR=1 FL=1
MPTSVRILLIIAYVGMLIGGYGFVQLMTLWTYKNPEEIKKRKRRYQIFLIIGLTIIGVCMVLLA